MSDLDLAHWILTKLEGISCVAATTWESTIEARGFSLAACGSIDEQLVEVNRYWSIWLCARKHDGAVATDRANYLQLILDHHLPIDTWMARFEEQMLPVIGDYHRGQKS